MNKLPTGLESKKDSLIVKLLNKSAADVATGCVVWTGPRAQNKYGKTKVGRKFRVSVHRLSFILNVGPIPQGAHVLHKCDNMLCVNPAHLFLGSNLDNIADRNRKGRTAKGSRIAQSKLTEEKVRQMRDLFSAGGKTHKEVGAIFGVHYKTAKEAITRVSWKHVV